MLTMAQQGMVNCLVTEDGREVTQFLRLPDSPCVIDGFQYRLSHDGKSARSTMEGPLGVVAVSYPSAKREITVDTTPHHFQLRRANWAGTRWELHVLGQQAGTCDVGALGASADLPTEIPLPARVFALYTVIMWGAGKFIPWI